MANNNVTVEQTVFTADVVEYNFMPEKYATAVAGVTAEINVDIKCNWQARIQALLRGEHSDQITAEEMAALADAQGQQVKRDSNDIAVGDAGNLSDAKALVQKILYSFARPYWDTTDTDAKGHNDTSVNAQMTTNLQTILASSQAALDSDRNKLVIDTSKVETDMKLASGASSDIRTANLTSPTSKLHELVNAYSFTPILQRFIAGGLFTVDAVDGDATDDASKRNFDTGASADGESDQVKSDSKIVFPVKVTVADDGVADAEDGSSSGDPQGLTFQLNITFHNTD